MDESHYNNDTHYLWYLSTVSMVLVYSIYGTCLQYLWQLSTLMRTENHRQTDESHYNNDTQYLWYLSTVSMVVIYAAVVAITLKRQAW